MYIHIIRKLEQNRGRNREGIAEPIIEEIPKKSLTLVADREHGPVIVNVWPRWSPGVDLDSAPKTRNPVRLGLIQTDLLGDIRQTPAPVRYSSLELIRKDSLRHFSPMPRNRHQVSHSNINFLNREN